MNVICMRTKIATVSGTLQPIILNVILNLYQAGNNQMTARLISENCNLVDDSVNWKGRLPAICNAMRNSIECGGIIVGEDRDFLEFTISFNAH